MRLELSQGQAVQEFGCFIAVKCLDMSVIKKVFSVLPYSRDVVRFEQMLNENLKQCSRQ